MGRAMSAIGEPGERERQNFIYELKFFVAPTQSVALKDWVRAHLLPDPHGGGPHGDHYHVSSVYFDTPQFAVLSRQGSYARSKYRLRRYQDSDIVYLERKTKGAQRVYKRRTATALDQMSRLRHAEALSGWDGYWFHRRLLGRQLSPTCRIEYQRLARWSHSDVGPVRLTIDQDLRAWPADGTSFERHGDGAELTAPQLILELKFGAAMPRLFKQLVHEFAPRPEGISKYRLACSALGLGARQAEAFSEATKSRACLSG